MDFFHFLKQLLAEVLTNQIANVSMIFLFFDIINRIHKWGNFLIVAFIKILFIIMVFIIFLDLSFIIVSINLQNEFCYSQQELLLDRFR